MSHEVTPVFVVKDLKKIARILLVILAFLANKMGATSKDLCCTPGLDATPQTIKAKQWENEEITLICGGQEGKSPP